MPQPVVRNEELWGPKKTRDVEPQTRHNSHPEGYVENIFLLVLLI